MSSGEDEALEDARTERLLRWMDDRGFRLNPACTIRRLPGRGRAMVATDDLPEDAELFVVPRPCLLLARTCAARDKFSWRKLKGNDWNGVIVALIVEQLAGEASAWKPYIDVLPEELTTPVFWSEEQRRELRGTAVESSLGLESIRADFTANVLPLLRSSREALSSCVGAAAVEAALAAGEEALWRSYLRFGSIVGAYSFVLEDSGECAMCPIADILNAQTGGNNARLFHEGHTLSMRTTRPVRKGEELLNTYGELPNGELLRRYGYVDVPNPNDCAELPGPALRRLLEARGLLEAAPAGASKKARKEGDPAAALAGRRRKAARQLLEGDFKVPADCDAVPRLLHAAVGLFCVPPADFDARAPAVMQLFEEDEEDEEEEEEENSKAAPPHFPPDAEGAARSIIREAVDAQLAAYPTTLEEDEAAVREMEGGPPDPGRHLRPAYTARVVRAGEKRALRRLRDALGACSCG